ncbi:uncharacterized protein LOC126372518 [Pectinophora gossypiella]|uniref:uncharacterized protein LOC126372518 n=1 Tax=Pectinophora gossypiella TaxID=13191 RepID=UPI00214EFA05|nr:uncharacterized protein LOC126372518 [Pectinophora gossypiella]
MAEEKEKEKLSTLVAKRGYIKGTLTRIHKFVTDSHELSVVSSKSQLEAKLNHLVNTFTQYENLNCQISVLNQNDIEDFGKVEEIFYFSKAMLLDAIEKRNKNDSSSTPPPSTSSVNDRKLKLPAINIEIFDGKSCAKYVTFINLFNSLIDSDTKLDNIQKLHYLRTYLKDEAFNIISELPLTQTSYLEALRLLKERYYNRHKIINEHVSLLLDLPTLGRGSNVRDFVSQIKQTLAALKNLNINVESWDPILTIILLRKLDGFTSRAFQLEREIGKEPTVAELLAFLEKRALAAENSPATASNWKPASRLAVNIAVQGSSCKKCAPAIYSDDEHTAAEPALVPAIEAAVVSAAEPAIVPAAAEPIAAA